MGILIDSSKNPESFRKKPNLLLGLSGSVATVKWIELALVLHEFYNIKVVATTPSNHFIRISRDYCEKYHPGLLERFDRIFVVQEDTSILDVFNEASATTVSDKTPLSLYRDDHEWMGYKEVKGDRVLHIDLRDWADMLVIAPLSANTLASIANGLSNNLLTSIVRAWPFQLTGTIGKPILLAPAMNTNMWLHPVTQEHLEKLTEQWGFSMIQPIPKLLACGVYGHGAMPEPKDVATAVIECHKNFAKEPEAPLDPFLRPSLMSQLFRVLHRSQPGGTKESKKTDFWLQISRIFAILLLLLQELFRLVIFFCSTVVPAAERIPIVGHCFRYSCSALQGTSKALMTLAKFFRTSVLLDETASMQYSPVTQTDQKTRGPDIPIPDAIAPDTDQLDSVLPDASTTREEQRTVYTVLHTTPLVSSSDVLISRTLGKSKANGEELSGVPVQSVGDAVVEEPEQHERMNGKGALHPVTTNDTGSKGGSENEQKQSYAVATGEDKYVQEDCGTPATKDDTITDNYGDSNTRESDRGAGTVSMAPDVDDRCNNNDNNNNDDDEDDDDDEDEMSSVLDNFKLSLDSTSTPADVSDASTLTASTPDDTPGTTLYTRSNDDSQSSQDGHLEEEDDDNDGSADMASTGSTASMFSMTTHSISSSQSHVGSDKDYAVVDRDATTTTKKSDVFATVTTVGGATHNTDSTATPGTASFSRLRTSSVQPQQRHTRSQQLSPHMERAKQTHSRSHSVHFSPEALATGRLEHIPMRSGGRLSRAPRKGVPRIYSISPLHLESHPVPHIGPSQTQASGALDSNDRDEGLSQCSDSYSAITTASRSSSPGSPLSTIAHSDCSNPECQRLRRYERTMLDGEYHEHDQDHALHGGNTEVRVHPPGVEDKGHTRDRKKASIGSGMATNNDMGHTSQTSTSTDMTDTSHSTHHSALSGFRDTKNFPLLLRRLGVHNLFRRLSGTSHDFTAPEIDFGNTPATTTTTVSVAHTGIDPKAPTPDTIPGTIPGTTPGTTVSILEGRCMHSESPSHGHTPLCPCAYVSVIGASSNGITTITESSGSTIGGSTDTGSEEFRVDPRLVEGAEERVPAVVTKAKEVRDVSREGFDTPPHLSPSTPGTRSTLGPLVSPSHETLPVTPSLWCQVTSVAGDSAEVCLQIIESREMLLLLFLVSVVFIPLLVFRLEALYGRFH